MPTIHLPYGTSTAARTIACPGWLEKSQDIPPRPAGEAAITGSMHHRIQEVCQRDGKTPEQCLGMSYAEGGVVRTLTEDDLDLSEIAYRATNQLLDDLDIDEMMTEVFVELVPGVAGGTLDLLGLSQDRKTLLDLDYKFGSVKVPVEESPQHSMGLISACADDKTNDMFSDVERIVYAIIQPRAKGGVFLWETTPEHLETFDYEFRAAMKKRDINPGSHCKYCPAEPYCPEKRAVVMGANLLGARALEELQAGADLVAEVEAWVKSMHEEMYLQLCRGVPLKGWKVVDKRAVTKWTDADGAAELLKSKRIAHRDITNPAKLRTPKQVADLLRKKGRDIDLTEFTKSESSGTTLAPEDDDRPAVIASDIQGHLSDIVE